MINMAKEATKAQFAQYGMLTIPDDILENYAKEMLKKKESIDGPVSYTHLDVYKRQIFPCDVMNQVVYH